jgi:hypothetical protein
VSEELESTDHVLFNCPLAVFLWFFVRDRLGWSSVPDSCKSLAAVVGKYSSKGKICTRKLFISAGVMWTLWKTRNAWVFEDKMVASPGDIAYKLVALLTFWKPMLQKVIAEVEGMINNLSRGCAEVGA